MKNPTSYLQNAGLYTYICLLLTFMLSLFAHA